MFSLVIIEDEIFTLELYKKIVNYEHFGFDVTRFFTNGKDACNYIENNRVDLVITDIDMPDVDGIDVGRFCRKKFPNTVVAFISAYQKFEFVLAALDNNVSNYLIKPITKEQIENLLKVSYVEIASKRYFDNEIDNNECIIKKQIMTEILCGVIQSERDYRNDLSKYNINDFLDRKFSVYKLHLGGLSDYINTKWKHDIRSLYHAMTFMLDSIITVEGLEFVSIRNSSDEIEFAILNVSDDTFLIEKIEESKSCLNKFFDNVFVFEEMFSYDNIQSYFLKNNDTISKDNNFLEMVDEYIRNNYTRKISLDDIAQHVSLSTRYFCSYYKKNKGETFFETLTNHRIEQSKIMLKDSKLKTSLVYRYVGFSNANYYYKEFKKKTGMTPAEYRSRFGC